MSSSLPNAGRFFHSPGIPGAFLLASSFNALSTSLSGIDGPVTKCLGKNSSETVVSRSYNSSVHSFHLALTSTSSPKSLTSLFFIWVIPIDSFSECKCSSLHADSTIGAEEQGGEESSPLS